MGSLKAKFIEVRQLLSERTSWTKRTRARNKVLSDVDPKSDTACAWCLLGAFERVSDSSLTTISMVNTTLPYVCIGEIPNRAYTYKYVFEFNDAKSTRHADVLTLLDKIIASFDSELTSPSIKV